MLCDNCKERDAVVHLTQIVASAVTQLHLCEKCAAEKGVETTVATPKHPLGDFLQAVQQQAAVPHEDASTCAFCSATARDFRTSGRLGCARCYSAFERSLRELLRRLHGSSKHMGRAYEAPAPGVLERANTLGELRERLRRAIESEQFELAADLRDRIRTMETGAPASR
jgi:protein arginine kinase activator